MGPKQLNKINVAQIVKAVSNEMSITEKNILGKKRDMHTALARQICMFLSKKLINLSLASIGSQIGGRDHSTVIHAYKNIDKKMENDVELKQIISKIEEKIR